MSVSDLCSYEEEKFGHRDAKREADIKTLEEASHLQAKERDSSLQNCETMLFSCCLHLFLCVTLLLKPKEVCTRGNATSFKVVGVISPLNCAMHLC